MKPFLHAKLSVKKYGGKVKDYLPIHNYIDMSKMCMPDMRHRALLHSSFGIYLVEMQFGVTIKNSAGKDVSTRDVAEEHVLQDLGFIPTVQDWLKNLPMEPWMTGTRKITKVMDFKKEEEQVVDLPKPTGKPISPNFIIVD